MTDDVIMGWAVAFGFTPITANVAPALRITLMTKSRNNAFVFMAMSSYHPALAESNPR